MAGGDDFRAISSQGEEEVLWLRVSILESFGTLEALLDQVIALHFTEVRDFRQILERDLLPRISPKRRLITLSKLLDWHMKVDNYPFFQLLPKAVDHRNTLAHKMLDIFESSDKRLVFTGWTEGEERTEKILMVDLRRSEAAIYHSIIDLRRIYWEFMDEIRAGDISDMKDLFGG